jgi:hypothetical protein
MGLTVLEVPYFSLDVSLELLELTVFLPLELCVGKSAIFLIVV